jgi:hypothetical protein
VYSVATMDIYYGRVTQIILLVPAVVYVLTLVIYAVTGALARAGTFHSRYFHRIPAVLILRSKSPTAKSGGFRIPLLRLSLNVANFAILTLPTVAGFLVQSIGKLVRLAWYGSQQPPSCSVASDQIKYMPLYICNYVRNFHTMQTLLFIRMLALSTRVIIDALIGLGTDAVVCGFRYPL